MLFPTGTPAASTAPDNTADARRTSEESVQAAGRGEDTAQGGRTSKPQSRDVNSGLTRSLSGLSRLLHHNTCNKQQTGVTVIITTVLDRHQKAKEGFSMATEVH